MPKGFTLWPWDTRTSTTTTVLRHDPLLAALVGKKDPRTEPLAGQSTLNRLELTPVGADSHRRYKKIVVHRRDVDRFFVDVFLQSYASPPACLVLDLDATDDPVPGDQLGKFFHGY